MKLERGLEILETAGDNNRVIYDGEIVEIGHQYDPNRIDLQNSWIWNICWISGSSHPDYGQFDGLWTLPRLISLRKMVKI